MKLPPLTMVTVLGNHKGGLSVGKAISSGCKAAESVISYLDSYPGDKLKDEYC